MSRRLGEILRKILKGPPLKFNPFVMSRVFYLWLFLGVAAGASAGIYWIVLEQIIYFASAVEDWKVIPLMGGAGLLAGLIIHWIGDGWFWGHLWTWRHRQRAGHAQGILHQPVVNLDVRAHSCT